MEESTTRPPVLSAPGSGPAPAPRRTVTLARIVSFGVIGVLSAVLYVPLYLLLRGWWPALAANLGALLLAGLFNTEANRRFTFDGTGVRRTGMHVRATVLFLISFAVTTGEVLLLRHAAPDAGRLVEVAALGAGQWCVTVFRFVGLDRWVFRRRRKS